MYNLKYQSYLIHQVFALIKYANPWYLSNINLQKLLKISYEPWKRILHGPNTSTCSLSPSDCHVLVLHFVNVSIVNVHQLVIMILFYIFTQLYRVEMIPVHSPTAPRVNLHHLIVVLFCKHFLSFQKDLGKSKSKTKVQIFCSNCFFARENHPPVPDSGPQGHQRVENIEFHMHAWFDRACMS